MMKIPQIPTPKNPEKGFTLIELMIVIAIIAILVAIALPAYQNYIKKAKFSEVIGSMSGPKTQVNLLYAEGTALASIADTQAYDQTVAAGGTAHVDLKAAGVICSQAIATLGADISGQSVTLTPVEAGGTLTWGCASTADAKYLPSSCTTGGVACAAPTAAP